MNLWGFLALVSVAGIVGGVIQTWIKSKHKQQSYHQESDQHQQQLAALDERIKILETIVTDSKYDLNRKFDNLQQKEKV